MIKQPKITLSDAKMSNFYDIYIKCTKTIYYTIGLMRIFTSFFKFPLKKGKNDGEASER